MTGDVPRVAALSEPSPDHLRWCRGSQDFVDVPEAVASIGVAERSRHSVLLHWRRPQANGRSIEMLGEEGDKGEWQLHWDRIHELPRLLLCCCSMFFHDYCLFFK